MRMQPSSSNLKEFIWKILELIQEYIFTRLKSDAEKQGKIYLFFEF